MKLSHTSHIVTTAAIALALVTGISAPQARADTASSAAIGAALGAFAGALLFDSSSHRYYYVRGGRHVYVSNTAARSYYQRRDPHFYAQHQRDFNTNGAQFTHEWNRNHH